MNNAPVRLLYSPESLVALALLFATGCAPLPPVDAPRRAQRYAPRPTPYAAPQRQPEPYANVPPPRPIPESNIDEESVGETAAPTLPENIPLEEPAPTAEVAALPPGEVPAPPDLVDDSKRDESLAPQIKAAKAPNVAAALRLVEEGRVQLNQQHYDQALSQLQRSVSIDPSSFYGYYYLAKLHQTTQDYSQAIAFASRATALGAQADRIWLGRAYALQGAIFEKVGRFADARAAYNRAYKTDPTNLTAYTGKSRLTPKEAPAPLAPATHEDSWH
jgi:tetratricopeptide (TPR) repeat protein